MASTHSTEGFRPLASWDTLEARYEARAVTLEVERHAARRARRRAALGMSPKLAYAAVVAAALALAVISWVTGGIVESYDDPGKGGHYVEPASEPAEPIQLTTTTGTTVQR